MRRAAYTCVAMLITAIAASASFAQEAKKIGEWHLDLQASQLPGPATKSDVRIYQQADDGMLRSIHHVVQADGRMSTTIYVARDDGMEYPMMDAKGRSLGTIALKPDGDGAQTFFTKRDGAVTGRGRTSLSKDGRQMIMVIDLLSSAAPPRQIKTVFTRVK